MKLSDLRMPAGANKDRKRVGRGAGSGHGKTAGKGTKGQKARTGGNVHPRFQGGQTPIQQQLPYKRGFTNIWKVRYNVVNLSQLASDEIEAGTELTPESLHKMGIMRNSALPLKILGDGEITSALHITAHKVSESARQKIEAAGGSVTLIDTSEQVHRSKGRTEAPLRARAERQAANKG
jgi:large subunit ribosomal protein L15